MQKLVWQNSNGDEIDLTSGNYGITNWEGFSNADLNIQSQQVPFQDGGVFLDALMEQRELSVTLAMNDGGNLETRYRLRRELAHALNPKLGEGYLIYTNDFISKRIKCVAQIPLFETHNSNDSGTPKASLAWTACNPYWEDLEEITIELSPDGITLIQNNGDIPTEVSLNIVAIENGDLEIINKNNNNEISLTLSDDLQDVLITTQVGNKTAIGRSLQNNIKFNNISNMGLFLMVNYKYIPEKKKVYIVGYYGTVITSEDGKKYEILNIGTNETLIDITCSPSGKLVLIGENGFIATSNDGTTWSIQTALAYNLSNIYFSEILNKFVILAIDSNGAYILDSTDGITWETLYSLPSSVRICGFVETNTKMYIACDYVEDNNHSLGFFSSSDGDIWAGTGVIYTQHVDSYTDFIYAEKLNRFAIISQANKKVITSADGITWGIQNDNITLNRQKYIDELGIVIGLKYNNGKYDLYITNSFTNWVLKNERVNYNIVFISNEGYFAEYGDDGIYKIYESFYRELLKTNINFDNIKDLKYLKSAECFFALKLGDTIKSKNGKEWKKNLPVGGGLKIASSDDTGQMLVSYGERTILSSFDNGKTWEIVSTTQDATDVLEYSPEFKKFYGGSNSLWSSVDGKTWQNVVAYNIYGFVSPKNGIAIAVGANGWISISTDGVTFTQQTSSTSENLNAITYSKRKNIYVTVGNNGVILTSQNGIDWISQTSGTNENLNSIVYAENLDLFVCVGNNGVILTSKNCISWTAINNGYTKDYLKIAYSEIDRTFVFASNQFIFTSIITTDYVNYISKVNSNLSFILDEGQNNILVTDITESTIKLSYRQKYIGV
jgi:photosystem II stability/assembly factor-like uncharacterized protein